MIALPSPTTSTVKPTAVPDAGALVNDTVVAPDGVKLNVLPVDRSRVCVGKAVEYWYTMSLVTSLT